MDDGGLALALRCLDKLTDEELIVFYLNLLEVQSLPSDSSSHRCK